MSELLHDCLISTTSTSSNVDNDLDAAFSLFTTNPITGEPNFMTCDPESYFKLPNENKQDVSIGTDLSISRDLRYKKDYETFDCLNRMRPHGNERESFKLIEKVQPKKSRTKYSKDQIEVLEGAYSRNPYPDVITVEQLCKALDITREKVNIWFQNRRARTKRSIKTPKQQSQSQDPNTICVQQAMPKPLSFSKFFKSYSSQPMLNHHLHHLQQQQQSPNLVFINSHAPNLNASYYNNNLSSYRYPLTTSPLSTSYQETSPQSSNSFLNFSQLNFNNS